MEQHDMDTSSTPGIHVRRKKRKAPKGILKNADPNATYHHKGQPDHLQQQQPIEALVEQERPLGASSHHRRHHRSNKESSSGDGSTHRKRSSSKSSSRQQHADDDEELENVLQEKNRRNHRHHSSSSKHEDKKHHRRSSSSSSKKQQQEEQIYEQPKVPAVKCDKKGDEGIFTAVAVRAGEEQGLEEDEQQGLYENLSYHLSGSDNDQLYDVPRSSRKTALVEEAIYVNGDDVQQQLLLLQLPPDYEDEPKTRDSLSTIEEEQYESHHRQQHLQQGDQSAYSVPRSCYDQLQQQQPVSLSDLQLSSTDDRSSGYRSSSSLQSASEELIYANEEQVIGEKTNNSTTRDVAIETTLERPAVKVANSVKNSKNSSLKSPAIAMFFEKNSSYRDASILKLDVPSDDFVTIGDIAGPPGSDEELLPIAPTVPQPQQQKQDTVKKTKWPLMKQEKQPKQYTHEPQPKQLAPPPPPPPPQQQISQQKQQFSQQQQQQQQPQFKQQENNTNDVENSIKKQQQRDRSVDVYNETVRQRAPRSSDGKKSRDVFALMAHDPTDTANSNTSNNEKKTLTWKRKSKKEKAPIAPSAAVPLQQQQQQDEDMPSVRQLRSKFESSSSSSLIATGMSEVASNAAPKKSLMFSLTRRGAVVTRSLHNLSEAVLKATKGSNSPTEKLVDDQSIFASPELRFGAGNFAKRLSSSAAVSGKQAVDTNKHQPAAQQQPANETQRYSPPKAATIPTQGAKWQPMILVAQMYELPELDDDEMDKNSAAAAYMEGQLERLPPGKKRSSLWNNWKKQYFVADRGILQSFGDQSKSSPLDRMELFGGKVEVQEGNVLVVEDRSGAQQMLLKCSTGDESARQWEKSIKANISQDFSKSFVTPCPLLLHSHLSFFSQTLVIDFGGASVRAGVAAIAFPTLPQLFFPSVMAVDDANEQAKYFGLDSFADEVRSRSVLSHPMLSQNHDREKHSVDQVALQGIFEKVFKDLAVEPNHYEIQLSVPRAFGDRTKEAIAGMLFEEFGVRAVNMAHQTTFAFHSYNAKSGVMVDLGERMDVVPIVEGRKVQSGVTRSSVGGKELRDKMQQHISGRGSSSSFENNFVTRYAVEKMSYMSRNFDKELEYYGSKEGREAVDKSLEIAPADCEGAPVRKLKLGSERFEACEGLFKPELWGLLDQAGVHVLVHKAIKECGVDVRREVTQSIFLAGGLTLIPGLRERLEAEVARLAPSSARPRVHASPYRYHAAYLGATAHAVSAAFKESRVTRDEWVKAGSRLRRDWTM